jgi:acyl-CoA oxidase
MDQTLSLDLILSEPALRPLIPLLWLAWDGDGCTASERDEIRREVVNLPWLDAGAGSVVERWLGGEDAPSPSAIETLRAAAAEVLGEGGGDSGGSAGREPFVLPEGVAELEERFGLQRDDLRRRLAPTQGGGPGEGPDSRASRAGDALDGEALHRFLDASFHDLRHEVFEAMATDPALAVPRGLPMAEYRERVLEAVGALGARGFGRLSHPVELGGTGDPRPMIAVFETLAHGDLSVLVKFGVQFGLWGGSILQLGTRRHHETYLPAVGSLELPGCYAMTERAHGSDVRNLQTTARFDPGSDEFVISTPNPDARKEWIGNAALHGRMAAVFAQLETGGEPYGVHAFLVPIRDEDGHPLPGVSIEDCGPKVGLNGIDNGLLGFDDVRVPGENLLDRFATVDSDGAYSSPIPSEGKRFFTMLSTLVGGRISVASASVAASRVALTVAVRYTGRRRQFGPEPGSEVPVLDYTLTQRALLPRLATTYALGFAVRALVDGFSGQEAEEKRRVLEVRAAGLKAYASEHALETIQASREACGGRGYAAENRLGDLRSDADIFTTFEGANPVLYQLVARGLLTRYRQELGDLGPWGLVRHLADRAGSRVREFNPVRTRRGGEEYLRDPDFHDALLEYREERLLASAARRLRGRISDGMHPFDAMNECQDHLVHLARAHVERLAARSFHASLHRAPNPGLSEALTTVYDLFVLSRVEADRAWFLEANVMEASQSTAVRALVNRLCAEVREYADLLVDGFGIPDEVLAAPAGLKEIP